MIKLNETAKAKAVREAKEELDAFKATWNKNDFEYWDRAGVIYHKEVASNKHLCFIGAASPKKFKRPDLRTGNTTMVKIMFPVFTGDVSGGYIQYREEPMTVEVQNFSVHDLVKGVTTDAGKFPGKLIRRLAEMTKALYYYDDLSRNTVMRALWTRGKSEHLMWSSYKLDGEKRVYRYVTRVSIYALIKELIQNPCCEVLLTSGLRAAGDCTDAFLPHTAQHLRQAVKIVKTGGIKT